MTEEIKKTAKDRAEFAGKIVREIEGFADSKSERGVILNLIVGLMTDTKAKVVYLPDNLSMFMNYRD